MRPLLQYLSDKEIRSAEECREHISKVFNLSNDDKALLKSKDRVGWAKWNLEQEGLLKTVSRGRYTITDKGIQYLNMNL